MMKQISYAWMAFVVGLALAVASPASAQEGSKLFEVLKRGKVIVGVTEVVPLRWTAWQRS